jgi:hypothetical protein
MFVLLERLRPRDSEQGLLRRGLATDIERPPVTSS